MFERFIARHAILRDNFTLLGYDLAFRPFAPEVPTSRSPLSAAYTIDAATMVFPWESLVGSHLAFIPCQVHELLSGAALLLPRARSVIDISPSVLCDADAILAVQDLKKAGYRLALSGWNANKERRPLADLCDFLRADAGALSATDRSGVSGAFSNRHPTLVAQSVDSWEALQAARRFGFTAFQGDFFLKPQLFRRREIAGTHLSALRLLRAILKDPLDLAEIESVVRQEPALTYKLLRYLNSPVMERPSEVRSIRNAISLLGEQEFRRWASLVAVVTPATEKTHELLRIGLTRAYFCEQIAMRCDPRSAYHYFFTGLFSVMDAVLDRPLDEIVKELALPDDVRRALLGEPGPLYDALLAALAYEQGAWTVLAGAMARISRPESCAPDCFRAAHTTAGAILS